MHRIYVGAVGLLSAFVDMGQAYNAQRNWQYSRHYNGRAPRGYRWPGVRYVPNGARECARRLRQIDAGQLKVS